VREGLGTATTRSPDKATSDRGEKRPNAGSEEGHGVGNRSGTLKRNSQIILYHTNKKKKFRVRKPHRLICPVGGTYAKSSKKRGTRPVR